MKSTGTKDAMITEKPGKAPKDIWDKAQILSQVLAALAIGLVSLVATILYNVRQSDSQRIQILQNFIQYLPTNKAKQQAGWLLLHTMHEDPFASKLLKIFRKSKAVSEVANFARSPNNEVAKEARKFLQEMSESNEKTVAKLAKKELRNLGTDCQLIEYSGNNSDCQNRLYHAFDLCNSNKFQESLAAYRSFLERCGGLNHQSVGNEIRNLMKLTSNGG